jgi:FMN hydrolase / 5-amino-6-(5-phospho-D-ribitylamino)uracil phosphatase
MNPKAPIRALSFDLDDTLWAIEPTIVRAEQLLHDWLGRHHPEIPALFNAIALRELTRVAARRWPDRAHDRGGLRRSALRLAAEQVGIAETFCEHTAFEVFQHARNEVELFPDALPVLTRLRFRYPLVALSNGNADLTRIGIDHLFVLALNPETTGTAKPDPAMYLAACEALDVDPGEVLHIGDDPRLDVLGAAAAGMRTVWFNREGRNWPGGGRRADAEIRNLIELEPLLETLVPTD